MSDLNKKNINYGALNRFYQDLKSHDLSDLNDKIDNIDVPEYVAGEGIAIDSANTISCTVKPIADVSALPDAEVNKDSVLRLEGDKKLYVAKYNPHNAPESEQIDNAYILISASSTIYKGVHTFTCTNGNLDMYIWGDIDDYLWATLQPASEIDSTTAYIINQDTLEDEFGYEGGDNINATISEVESVRKFEYQVYPIKYNYTWQRVVTEDELYQNESTFTGATLTVDGSQPSIVASGSTTIVWDDLASTIPSGKSVEVSVVVINTGSSALTPTMSGNVQMMGDGNLTIQTGELGLYRGRYISALDKWLVEAIYQEVSGIAE